MIKRIYLTCLFLMAFNSSAFSKEDSWNLALLIGVANVSYELSKDLYHGIKNMINLHNEHVVEKRKGSIKVGHLNIKGPIQDVDAYIMALQKLQEDDSYHGLLLSIESYGGQVGAASALFYELKRLRELMPVVVLVQNFCLSAAYHIASAADVIVASPNAEVGSIGVIGFHYYYTTKPKGELASDFSGKIAEDFVIAGNYKYTSFNKLTDEQRAFEQQQADTHYNQICRDIAESRNIIRDHSEWADGKSFVAAYALDLGLVDKVGAPSDAKDILKELIQKRNEVIGEFSFELLN